MTLAESLASLEFLVQVTTNVSVAFYVFPMWRQRRLRFFLILGFSALLGIFTTVASWTVGRNPMSEQDYYWFWCATTLLGAVDLILYGLGIILMVRYFQSTPPAATPSLTPQ